VFWIDRLGKLSDTLGMSQGVAGWVGVVVLCGLALAGCGSGSSSDTGPNMTATADCGSESEPIVLTLSGISPVAGASVPNSAIVQTFTIDGMHLQILPTFALTVAHTAGQPTPSPVGWTMTLSGANTLYTSQPITWQTAPGHVELAPPGLLEDTKTHCVSILPTPTFSYDVTAP
jgi:hypothetical protein